MACENERIMKKNSAFAQFSRGERKEVEKNTRNQSSQDQGVPLQSELRTGLLREAPEWWEQGVTGCITK